MNAPRKTVELKYLGPKCSFICNFCCEPIDQPSSSMVPTETDERDAEKVLARPGCARDPNSVPLCNIEKTAIVVTNCGHTFHKVCYEIHFFYSRVHVCPDCQIKDQHMQDVLSILPADSMTKVNKLWALTPPYLRTLLDRNSAPVIFAASGYSITDVALTGTSSKRNAEPQSLGYECTSECIICNEPLDEPPSIEVPTEEFERKWEKIFDQLSKQGNTLHQGSSCGGYTFGGCVRGPNPIMLCSIDKTTIVVTNCGHLFHKVCLEVQFFCDRIRQCPKCETKDLETYPLPPKLPVNSMTNVIEARPVTAPPTSLDRKSAPVLLASSNSCTTDIVSTGATAKADRSVRDDKMIDNGNDTSAKNNSTLAGPDGPFTGILNRISSGHVVILAETSMDEKLSWNLPLVDTINCYYLRSKLIKMIEEYNASVTESFSRMYAVNGNNVKREIARLNANTVYLILATKVCTNAYIACLVAANKNRVEPDRNCTASANSLIPNEWLARVEGITARMVKQNWFIANAWRLKIKEITTRMATANRSIADEYANHIR